MDPRDASVYTDTMSPLTWVLILSVVIVCVMTLMVAFIALVHRSIEHSVDTPRIPALQGLPATSDPSSSSPVDTRSSTHAA